MLCSVFPAHADRVIIVENTLVFLRSTDPAGIVE